MKTIMIVNFITIFDKTKTSHKALIFKLHNLRKLRCLKLRLSNIICKEIHL